MGKLTPIAWLRDAQADAEDEALVVCAKGDPGSFPVYSREGIDALVEALEAMLRHSCVADSAPEDKDPEDHDAERQARAALEAAKEE